MSRIDQGNDRDNVLRDDEGTIGGGSKAAISFPVDGAAAVPPGTAENLPGI